MGTPRVPISFSAAAAISAAFLPRELTFRKLRNRLAKLRHHGARVEPTHLSTVGPEPGSLDFSLGERVEYLRIALQVRHIALASASS
jgi:hypothetical protein